MTMLNRSVKLVVFMRSLMHEGVSGATAHRTELVCEISDKEAA